MKILIKKKLKYDSLDNLFYTDLSVIRFKKALDYHFPILLFRINLVTTVKGSEPCLLCSYLDIVP